MATINLKTGVANEPQAPSFDLDKLLERDNELSPAKAREPISPAKEPMGAKTSTEYDFSPANDFASEEISSKDSEDEKSISNIDTHGVSPAKDGLSPAKVMRNYKREKYDGITIDVEKGSKKIWKEEASKRGLSLQRMIIEAVSQYLTKPVVVTREVVKCRINDELDKLLKGELNLNVGDIEAAIEIWREEEAKRRGFANYSDMGSSQELFALAHDDFKEGWDKR